MSVQYLTLVHVAISLAGIAAGFGALAEWLSGRLAPRWTAAFLATTVVTSATGFLFPFNGVTPGIVIGVISMAALAVALYALYVRRLAGSWRKAFVISSVAALYFNFFVLVAQLFQKIPALVALAPSQSAPAFAITQGIVLAAFLILGAAAVRSFRKGLFER